MRLGVRSVLLLLPVLATFACGGGGGSGDGGVVDPSPSPIVASFRGDDTSPGANTVAMIQGASNADVVTVKATVTNTTGIYATAFDVVYDRTKATFVNWSAGTLLEQGGHTPTYQISDNGNGRVIIAASRNGNVGTASASGTVTIVNLTFRVRVLGDSRAEFAPGAVLYDGQLSPQPKTGIVWTAGTLAGTQ